MFVQKKSTLLQQQLIISIIIPMLKLQLRVECILLHIFFIKGSSFFLSWVVPTGKAGSQGCSVDVPVRRDAGGRVRLPNFNGPGQL